MPGTRDVGANMRELNKSNKARPHKQKVAIALSQAREAGANIPYSPSERLARAQAKNSKRKKY